MIWHLLTLVGTDRPGIVAAVTQALFDGRLSLGEASMLRLGGNFTMSMMVSGAADSGAVEQAVAAVAKELDLHVHVDQIRGGLHQHLVPNLHVTVSGADRAGIVAQVTGALAEAGFNILDLASDVAGSADEPVYIMQIEGIADVPVEEVEAALSKLRLGDVNVNVSAIDTMVG